MYGEINKSHGCVGSTIDDVDLRSFLTAFTDRPSSLAPGTLLEPYISGTRHGSYFTFTKTFPDLRASRAGMVFTHVLIVNIEDIRIINDLSVVFAHFIADKPEKISELAALQLDVSILSIKPTSTTFPVFIQQTVAMMVSSKTPVFYCGTLDSHKKTIVTIWTGLPLAFRKQFSFTASFNCNNVDKSKTIIYFQKTIEHVLVNQDYVSDTRDELVEIESEVERYLLCPEPNNDFEAFMISLGVKFNDWTLLPPCVKTYHLYLILETTINSEQLKLLVRYIAKISPEARIGKDIKAKILRRLSEFILGGKENNIKSLRNIPVNEFETGLLLLPDTIKAYFYKVFRNHLPFNANLILELADSVEHNKPLDWWEQTVVSALKTEGESELNTSIINIWTLLTYSEDSAARFIKFIPDAKYKEIQLIDFLPSTINKSICEGIIKAIKHRNWYLLHANLLLKYKTCKAAVAEQIDFEEKDPSKTFEGTLFLLDKLKDEELLSLALSKGTSVLVNEFGNRSVQKSFLLSELDVKNSLWLQIWSVSLEKTKSLVHGITMLPVIINDLINLLLERKKVPDNIVSLILRDGHGDLTSYPNRKEIWSKIPSDFQSTFLNTTADGYTEKLITGSLTLTESKLEPELHNVLTDSQFVEAFLFKKKNDIQPVLTFYEKVSGLSDKQLSLYIGAFTGGISELQSSQLGNLVMFNKFTFSANKIFEKAKGNLSYRIALTNCKTLLNFSFLDILFYGNLIGETVSEKAAYSGLSEFAISAYRLGPEDRDIWERAGGSLSKLNNSKSREENWRHAIELLRNGGGGGNISVKSLIKVMLEDYQNNPHLKEIQKYFKSL